MFHAVSFVYDTCVNTIFILLRATLGTGFNQHIDTASCNDDQICCVNISTFFLWLCNDRNKSI